MSVDRWMAKEDVVHTYNEILLSHKKERNWVICSDMDKPRVCHTEWSKSERGKQILYINRYIWKVEKWCWCTYLQRCRHRERTCGHSGGKGESRTSWERSRDVHTPPRVKEMASRKLPRGTGGSARGSVMTWRAGMGEQVQREGMYVCTWLMRVAVQQKLTRHCSASICQ